MYVYGKLHFTNWVHIFFTKLLMCRTPLYYKLCNTYANDLTALIKTYNYEVFILNFDILGFRIILHCYEVDSMIPTLQKNKKKHEFSYSKNTVNFEVFHLVISANTNFTFLKSLLYTILLS